jgi:hypothetical protein
VRADSVAGFEGGIGSALLSRKQSQTTRMEGSTSK